jgi:hypothetical protein
MTYEEVKRIFRTKFLGTCCIDFENGDGTNECECPNTDCENCRIAEAERMILEALEKQIPKKPIATTKEKRSLGEYDDWQSCPRCKTTFGYCTRKDEVTYCPKCGQAIDWSEI